LRRPAGSRATARTFDLVSVTFVLHEMEPDLRVQVLGECRRVTKPGGRILLMDFHYGP